MNNAAVPPRRSFLDLLPISCDVLLRACNAAAAVAVVALLCFVPLSSNDFWLQSAIGRIIWNTGEIPRTALFPFTEARDFPFYAHEWLSSVALHLLHESLGYDNLIFVKGLLGLALFGLSYRLAHRLTGSFAIALAVSLLANAVANYRHELRPEIFGLLFTLVLLNLLVEYETGRKWRHLLGCIPVALLWANTHASFPVALVLGASFAAGAFLDCLWGRGAPGERLRAGAYAARPYAACTALMALAMLVNPFGLELFRFSWDLQHSAFLRSYIYEWMPTLTGPFAGSRGYWAFLIYVAIVAAAALAGWRNLRSAAILLLAVFGWLALETHRHVPFFAFAAIYPLAIALGAYAPRMPRSPAAQGAMLAALGVCAGLVFRYGNIYYAFPYFAPSNDFTPMFVDYVEGHRLRGNVLNSYALGAELVYRFYPGLRPAIDSRADVYGEAYLANLRRLSGDERAIREFIGRYDVRYMLLLWWDFDNGVRRLPGLRDDGWRIVFADHKMVLLGRPGR